SACARWVDTSASSLAGWKTLAADPWFNPSPVVTITSGPANPTRVKSAQFNWTSTDPNASFTCSLDGAAATACTSPKSYSALALADHWFTVTATNADGLTGAQTWRWTVTDMVTSITSSPIDQTTLS